MAVYILSAHSGVSEVVKIGYSRNVLNRISEIQTGNHEELKEILIFMDLNKKFETYLHNLFIDWKKRGEWYSFRGRLKEIMLGNNTKKYLPIWFKIGNKNRTFILDKLFRMNEIDFLKFWLVKGDREQQMSICIMILSIDIYIDKLKNNNQS